jgi:hydroxypyruvate isomerase
MADNDISEGDESMQRRDFIMAGGAIAGGMLAVKASAAAEPAATTESAKATHKFQLKYAPHFGMFRASAGDDPVEQLRFAAGEGFTAWEDNGMKGRSVEEQERIAKAMNELGIAMGVFVANAEFGKVTFARKKDAAWDAVLADIRASVDVAKRVNAKWMTVVPGRYDQGLEWDYQTANCVELLKRCSAILEPHGLVMVLEPLNWFANHPGVFLHKIPQAYQICRAVGSPSCKILFDIYHQQISEGNLIPNMDLAWEEVAYLQVGDNPGRNEPGTGEINYRNVFQHAHAKGFDGIVGMEHGNSRPGRDGERAVIDAYVAADAF